MTEVIFRCWEGLYINNFCRELNFLWNCVNSCLHQSKNLTVKFSLWNPCVYFNPFWLRNTQMWICKHNSFVDTGAVYFILYFCCVVGTSTYGNLNKLFFRWRFVLSTFIGEEKINTSCKVQFLIKGFNPHKEFFSQRIYC